MAPRPLRIVRSCGESWDAMAPREGGRHCASCDRVVLDLSGTTLQEARARLDRARRETGGACGRAERDPETGALVFAPAPEAPRPLRRAARGALLAAALVAGCDIDGRVTPAPVGAHLVPLPPTPIPSAADAGALATRLPPPPPLVPCAAQSADAGAGPQRQARHHKRPAPTHGPIYDVGFME